MVSAQIGLYSAKISCGLRKNPVSAYENASDRAYSGGGETKSET